MLLLCPVFVGGAGEKEEKMGGIKGEGEGERERKRLKLKQS